MERKIPKKTDVLSGFHSVFEALSANRRRFYEICTAKPLSGKIAAAAAEKRIPVVSKTAPEIERLAQTERHQSIAARTAPFVLRSMDELLRKSGSDAFPPLYLLIDSVTDPQNAGALVRSAVCAGISGIIFPKDRSAPLTPAVSRASAGAMEHCDIARVTNLVSAMKMLKKHSIWITGLDPEGILPIYEADMTTDHAIVVGGEHTGIRRLVMQHCDNLCHIPQCGPVNSLNASVAGAIAVYEAIRQRTADKKNGS